MGFDQLRHHGKPKAGAGPTIRIGRAVSRVEKAGKSAFRRARAVIAAGKDCLRAAAVK